MALLGVRVAPGDHEHLLALADQPLDHAAPGREVEHVELVDRRRREQQRDLAHRLGLRRVLDQLEHVGAQHDRARSQREVLADGELAGVDGRRAGRGKSRRKCRAPRDEVRAALVDARLDHGRVRPREVARRERVEHVAGGEARLALGAPVQLGVGDQAVDGVARGQVGLQQPPEQPVRLARPDRRSAGRAWPAVTSERPAGHAGQLRAQSARPGGPARCGWRASPIGEVTAAAAGGAKRDAAAAVASVSITSSADSAASTAVGCLGHVSLSCRHHLCHRGAWCRAVSRRRPPVIPLGCRTFALMFVSRSQMDNARGNQGSSATTFSRLVEQEEMPAALDHVQCARPGIRAASSRALRTRHARVLFAGDHQRRLAAGGAATAGSTTRRPRTAGRRSRARRAAAAGGRPPAPAATAGSRAVRPPAMYGTLSASSRGW